MYSKSDTVTVEGGGIDDLVNLFRGLRKDMSDQKNPNLLLEEENRKEENKRFTGQLKATKNSLSLCTMARSTG